MADKDAPKARTRIGTLGVSGYFPADATKAFRVLAAQQDKDVQELLAEAMNMVFERYQVPTRIKIVSGKRRLRAPKLDM